MRAIAALRRLHPRASYHLIAVESGLHRYQQLLQHVQANNVHNHTLVHGFITAAAARAQLEHGSKGVVVPRSHSPYAVGEPLAVTLSELLEAHGHIDYLDFDIQGAELEVFSEPQAIETLNAKVRAVHVGTHAPYIHDQVRDVMLREGWGLALDMEHNPRMVECDSTVQPSRAGGEQDVWGGDGPGGWGQVDWLQRDPSCLTHTEYGPMYVRDGLLSFYNPNFGSVYE